MNNYQFDSLKFATEGLTGGGCTIISDVKGLPSFMIPFNKRTNAQLFDGGSEKTHSAFLVDDVEYKRFFFSKFINCIVGRAWPIPGRWWIRKRPSITTRHTRLVTRRERAGI